MVYESSALLLSYTGFDYLFHFYLAKLYNPAISILPSPLFCCKVPVETQALTIMVFANKQAAVFESQSRPIDRPTPPYLTTYSVDLTPQYLIATYGKALRRGKILSDRTPPRSECRARGKLFEQGTWLFF